MSRTPNIYTDKKNGNMFIAVNNMDPGSLPDGLMGLTVIEQQLVERISSCINVHLLKHGE